MSTSSGNSSLTSDMIREVFPTLAVKKRIFKVTVEFLIYFTALNDTQKYACQDLSALIKGQLTMLKPNCSICTFMASNCKTTFKNSCHTTGPF